MTRTLHRSFHELLIIMPEITGLSLKFIDVEYFDWCQGSFGSFGASEVMLASQLSWQVIACLMHNMIVKPAG